MEVSLLSVCAGTTAPKTWNRLPRQQSPSTAWCSSICTSPSLRPTPSSIPTAAVLPAVAVLTAPALSHLTAPAATAAAPVEMSVMILQLLVFWRTSSQASSCLPQGAPNWPNVEQRCTTADFITAVALVTACLWALKAGEFKLSSDLMQCRERKKKLHWQEWWIESWRRPTLFCKVVSDGIAIKRKWG